MPTTQTQEQAAPQGWNAPLLSRKQFVYIAVGGVVLYVLLGILSNGLGGRVSYESYPSYYDSSSKSSSAISDPASSSSWLPGTSNNASQNVVGNMTQDRQITKNSLSIHVKDATSYVSSVKTFISSVNGKVMSEYDTSSIDSNSGTATLRVLVPNAKAAEFFAFLEKNAIKIVNKNVISYEISQEYTDIARELAQQEATYARISEFYSKAKTVDELLSIQKQLTSVRQQIDSLKGRQQSLTELSENTQFTLYISTNEFSLPYVPEGTFEVEKTFKLAVRSLIGTLDELVKLLIWTLVYIPVWAVIAAVAWFAYKKLKKKS